MRARLGRGAKVFARANPAAEEPEIFLMKGLTAIMELVGCVQKCLKENYYFSSSSYVFPQPLDALHDLGRLAAFLFFIMLYDLLEPWIPRIKEAELQVEKVRVFFNNHARAKSVRNAILLMDMLLIEHKHKDIQLQDQFTLGEF